MSILHTLQQRPEWGYRFAWLPGSIAIWDNRTSQHMALNDYHGQRRLMHRVTVEGVPLARYEPEQSVESLASAIA